jgi:hypothetical protein
MGGWRRCLVDAGSAIVPRFVAAHRSARSRVADPREVVQRLLVGERKPFNYNPRC